MRSQTKSYKKFLNTKLAVFVLALIFILIILAVVKNLSQQKEIDQSSQKLANEIANLKKQNLELNRLINFFASQEFIEHEAREKLNLAKPGERMVIVPKESRDVIQKKIFMIFNYSATLQCSCFHIFIFCHFEPPFLLVFYQS